MTTDPDLRDDRTGTDVPTATAGSARPAHRRVGFWLAAAFTVGTFGVWVYALFLYDPGLLTDELEDRCFSAAAEPVCAAAVAEVEQLPRAETTRDPLERAEVIDRANGILGAMVVELRRAAPTEPEVPARAVSEWLDHWEQHLGNRQDYADALRTDPSARFTEDMLAGKQVSRAIDGFAQVNRMRSCETPGDVG